jgi:hypothetical protein
MSKNLPLHIRQLTWSKEMKNVHFGLRNFGDADCAFTGKSVVDNAFFIQNTPYNVYRLIAKVLPSLSHYCENSHANIILGNYPQLNNIFAEYLTLLNIHNITCYNICDVQYINNLQQFPYNALPPGPGSALTYDWITKYRKLITAPSEYKKIVIVRQNLRNMPANILYFLISEGFKLITLETMSVQEQINLFAGANQIVGVQGAGLGNTVYCTGGCKILEISAGFDIDLYTSLTNHINNTLQLNPTIYHYKVDRDEVIEDQTFRKRYTKKIRKEMFFDQPVRLSYDRFIKHYNHFFNNGN